MASLPSTPVPGSQLPVEAVLARPSGVAADDAKRCAHFDSPRGGQESEAPATCKIQQFFTWIFVHDLGS